MFDSTFELNEIAVLFIAGVVGGSDKPLSNFFVLLKIAAYKSGEPPSLLLPPLGVKESCF